jgi:CheY-like chemotaxis protein
MAITLRIVSPAERPAKGAKRPAPAPKEKDAFLKEGTLEANPPRLIGGNRRILVVDDNPVVLKAFELKLKADGFSVTTTTDGATVASTAEQAQAELIVLDINFPAGGAMEWNGFTVMQWLNRFPELRKIPIILISGSEASEYKDKALAAGAIDYFQKPVVYNEIREVILRTLKGARAEPANRNP